MNGFVLASRRAFLATALLVLPCAAALAQEQTAQAAAPIKLRYADTLNSATFPILYARDNGLFSKRGLDVTMTFYANFDAVYTAFRAGAADLGAAGTATAVNLRGNGVPIKILYGMNWMANDILVQPKSGITDPKQLKGKKIGVFGGAAGTTANMFMQTMIKEFGFDPRTDSEIRYGAAGLLAGLLAKGDIDAFVSNDPVTSVELAAGRAVAIGELSQIYSKKHGYRPLSGALAGSDAFIGEQPGAVLKFVEAWQEAVTAFEKDPQLWLAMLKQHMKIDDVATANLLRDRLSGRFVKAWDGRSVQSELDALKYMSGKGFLETIPADVFWVHK